jgi:hypothetical protein
MSPFNLHQNTPSFVVHDCYQIDLIQYTHTHTNKHVYVNNCYFSDGKKGVEEARTDGERERDQRNV